MKDKYNIIYYIIGLDATASLKLLKQLDKLAASNRTVILTIHQPRMEIFHMFRKLVLLSNGKVIKKYRLSITHFVMTYCTCTYWQVSYHDVPKNAYEVFVNALADRYLLHKKVLFSLVDDHNPAGD